MTPSNIITLEADSIKYFSQYDEESFFEWLGKLSCVKKFEGQGTVLYIDVDLDAVDEYSLRDILALFRRYNISMKQLAIFDRAEFADWFRNEKKYWYKDIFS